MKVVICRNVYINGWGKEKECRNYKKEEENMCKNCLKRPINLMETLPNKKTKRYYPLNKDVRVFYGRDLIIDLK